MMELPPTAWRAVAYFPSRTGNANSREISASSSAAEGRYPSDLPSASGAAVKQVATVCVDVWVRGWPVCVGRHAVSSGGAK